MAPPFHVAIVTITDHAHCVSTLCAASAEDAFAFVADPGRLGEWALGCWQAVERSDGIVEGTSLFDGGRTYTYLNLAGAIRAIKAGKDINYEGAGGPVDFDKNGDLNAALYNVYEYKDGKQDVIRQLKIRK